jgi:arylsulfatase A-like enzyme
MGPLAMRGRMAMVRTAEWKLVHHQGAPGELYDLHADPDELINRFADPACIAVRAELMGSLVDFLLE